MKFFLIFTLIFCSVFALPNSQILERKGLKDELKEALENAKKQLPCGYPEFGVPPLAPYEKEYTEVQYEHKLFSILGVFTDTEIDGLNDFTVNDVDFSIFTLKAKFDLNFNKIHLSGDYNLNWFIFNLIKITGKGKLDVTLKNLRIHGTARIGSNGNGLYMKELDVIVALGNIKSNTSGLLGGGLLGRLANRSIENFVMYFIKHQEEFITETIHDEIVPKINSYLHGKSVRDLLELIESARKPSTCEPPKKSVKPKKI